MRATAQGAFAVNKRGTMLYPEEDARFILFTDEQLQALADLYRAGKSTRQISARYGISPTTVTRRLVSMGVKLRCQGHNHNYVATPHKVATARRMRASGHRWKAIEGQLGVTADTLMAAIRRERAKEEQ